MDVSKQFKDKWNFHNCLGALDGKHIKVRQPINSGSYYFNYKNFHSIVLMGLVDANYKFLYVDIGCNGRVSDGGVFKNCSLWKALENKELNIPIPRPLPGGRATAPIPFMIVADDAFPLKSNIMKPYGQANLGVKNRIFNYRLSRARRVVENAFGILANRFRVFMTGICLDPQKVQVIAMACCSLHNFLIQDLNGAQHVYVPPGSYDTKDPTTHGIINGEWRDTQQEWQPIPRQGSNRPTQDAKAIREYLVEYYNSKEGEVPWQYSFI